MISPNREGKNTVKEILDSQFFNDPLFTFTLTYGLAIAIACALAIVLIFPIFWKSSLSNGAMGATMLVLLVVDIFVLNNMKDPTGSALIVCLITLLVIAGIAVKTKMKES